MTTQQLLALPLEKRAEYLRNRLLDDERIGDRRHVAYIMATVRHETGVTRRGVNYTYLPVEEMAPGPVKLREMGFANAAEYFERKYGGREDLGNTEPGYGALYIGRGKVQTTGHRNYYLFEKKLGIPLVEKPELALEYEHSYDILVLGMTEGLFTGKRLAQYIHLNHIDFFNARRIVNSVDRADRIAGYAREELEQIARLV